MSQSLNFMTYFMHNAKEFYLPNVNNFFKQLPSSIPLLRTEFGHPRDIAQSKKPQRADESLHSFDQYLGRGRRRRLQSVIHRLLHSASESTVSWKLATWLTQFELANFQEANRTFHSDGSWRKSLRRLFSDGILFWQKLVLLNCLQLRNNKLLGRKNLRNGKLAVFRLPHRLS